METIAQLEADMIRERTRTGIEAAKAAGKHTGRPPFGFDVNNGYLTPNEKVTPKSAEFEWLSFDGFDAPEEVEQGATIEVTALLPILATERPRRS